MPKYKQKMRKSRTDILESVKALIQQEMSQADVQAADDMAATVHKGVFRKTTAPYVTHVRAAQRQAAELGYGKDIQIICLLHDILEHAINKKKMESLIFDRFGPEILDAVKLLTHDKSIPYKVYLLYMAKSGSRIAKKAFKVKMLDMYNNLMENPTEKQKDKYREAIIHLIENGHKDKVPRFILDKLEIKDELKEVPKEPNSPAQPKPDKKDSKKAPAGGDPFATSGGGGAPGGDASGPGGDETNPFADDTGGDMPGGEEEPPEDSIAKYNEKLSSMNTIKFSKKEPEPGFQFMNGNPQYYTEHYVARSKDGSVLLAVPKIRLKDESAENMAFFEKYILGQITQAVNSALKQRKRVVLIGNFGLPYFENKYQTNEMGIIAKVLNTRYPKGYVQFDTWNPKDYYVFMSNSNVWKQLKERTEAKGKELKAAMYLNAVSQGNAELANKLGSDDVKKLIEEWGMTEELIKNKAELFKALHPEEEGMPLNLPSYIITVYEYLLRVAMLEKVHRYEQQGKVAIVPVDLGTGWVLQDSFKKMHEMKGGKEAPSEEPEDEEPKDKANKKEKKPEKPEKKPEKDAVK